LKQSLFFSLLIFLLFGCQSSQQNNLISSTIPKPIQIHGHRGSRGTHPENTLIAFDEAVLSGVDWVELDLVLTKEGTPIVAHDPTVSVDLCLDSKKRPLSRLIPIKHLSLAKLKTFDCGSVPNPRFPEQKAVPGQTMPTFEEVLLWTQRYPDKKIKLNVELKMTAPKSKLIPNPRNFVASVAKLLRKYNVLEQVVLQSFDFRVLKAAREMEPTLKLSALFKKHNEIYKTTQSLGAQIASPEFNLLTSQLVDECHQMGLEVHPWTLNSDVEWKKALSFGVDGIITDYPRKLKTFLSTR